MILHSTTTDSLVKLRPEKFVTDMTLVQRLSLNPFETLKTVPVTPAPFYVDLEDFSSLDFNHEKSLNSLLDETWS